MVQPTGPSCWKHFAHMGLTPLSSCLWSTFCNSRSTKPHQPSTAYWGPLTQPRQPQTSWTLKIWAQWMQTIKCTKSQEFTGRLKKTSSVTLEVAWTPTHNRSVGKRRERMERWSHLSNSDSFQGKVEEGKFFVEESWAINAGQMIETGS